MIVELDVKALIETVVCCHPILEVWTWQAELVVLQFLKTFKPLQILFV